MKLLSILLICLTTLNINAKEVKYLTLVRGAYNDKLIEIIYDILEKNKKLKDFRRDISIDLAYIQDMKIKEIFINAYTLEFICRFEIEAEEDYLPVNPKLVKYGEVIRKSKRHDIYFYMEALYPDDKSIRGRLLTSGYVLDYIKRKIKKLNEK